MYINVVYTLQLQPILIKYSFELSKTNNPIPFLTYLAPKLPQIWTNMLPEQIDSRHSHSESMFTVKSNGTKFASHLDRDTVRRLWFMHMICVIGTSYMHSQRSIFLDTCVLCSFIDREGFWKFFYFRICLWLTAYESSDFAMVGQD